MKMSYLYWPGMFFSTAFGAGIFFLPQSVGPNVLGMTLFLELIFPAACLSSLIHYFFYRFISDNLHKDYLSASSAFIGNRVAPILCVFFILAMLMIVIINFTTLTNLLCNLADAGVKERFAISCGISLLLTAGYIIFHSDIGRLVSKISLVSILMVSFLAILFFLLPARNPPLPNIGITTVNSLMLFPIFLFTFNFTSCIQRFIRSNKKPDPRHILLGTFIILCFLLVVVISVSRLLMPDDIFTINNNNTDALSYVSVLTTSPVIVGSSLILIILMTSGAFLGTLTGVVDGAKSLGIRKVVFVLLANSALCVTAGTLNLSIIKMISAWSMPVIVITVFLIPALYYLKNGNGLMQLGAVVILFSGLAVISIPFI